MSIVIRDQMAVMKLLLVVDDTLRRAEGELAREKEGIVAAQKELSLVQSLIALEQQRREQSELLRNKHVQEARVLAQQLERSREKLGRARNEKECNAIERELEEIKKLIREEEESIGKKTLELDEVKKKVVALETSEAHWLDELGKSEGAASSRIQAIEERQRESTQSRQAIIAKLPTTLLKRYDQVRSRRVSGATFLDAPGVCRACRMNLPPMVVQKVTRYDAMEACPGCHRFLVYEPPTP